MDEMVNFNDRNNLKKDIHSNKSRIYFRQDDEQRINTKIAFDNDKKVNNSISEGQNK